jgi:hypothetical protein
MINDGSKAKCLPEPIGPIEQGRLPALAAGTNNFQT